MFNEVLTPHHITISSTGRTRNLNSGTMRASSLCRINLEIIPTTSTSLLALLAVSIVITLCSDKS